MLRSSQKLALFRFEASPSIGAGHAVRSCVIADCLRAKGWAVQIITSKETYQFLKHLDKYHRLEPEEFYNQPFSHDLLIIDHYDIDTAYESYFRPFVEQILVIDDLANRQHDCDILVDQTFGRLPSDYQPLVPKHCKILTGSEYALLRPEFAMLRPKALEKRRNTKEIKRVLISMGGSDPQNYTLQALKLIQDTGFKGAIDVVLGFDSIHKKDIAEYADTLPNQVMIHIDARMEELIYEADLAIGAAGSSVWEKCCLGLPSVLIVTADNQKLIYENLVKNQVCYSSHDLKYLLNKKYFLNNELCEIDGKGVSRIEKLVV